MAPKISLEVISDPQGFLNLRPTWDKLVTTYGHKNPILEFDWLYHWWLCFGQTGVLKILLFQRKDEVLAIIPFIIRKRKTVFLTINMVEFLGTGWFQNLFLIIKEKSQIIEMTLEWLRQSKDLWDVANLARLPSESLDIKSFQRSGKHFSLFIHLTETLNPHIPIASFTKENGYLHVQSRNFRTIYKKKSKRLNVMGEVNYKHYSDGNFPSEDIIRHIMYPIIDKSWKARTGASILLEESGREFYEWFIRYAQERGWLSLSVLYVDHIPIAYLLGIQYAGKYYAIDTAYDASFSEASPGMLLHVYSIERSFESSLYDFDFGYMQDYKTRWTEHFRKEYNIQIYSNRIFSLLLYGRQRYGKPLLKKIRTLVADSLVKRNS